MNLKIEDLVVAAVVAGKNHVDAVALAKATIEEANKSSARIEYEKRMREWQREWHRRCDNIDINRWINSADEYYPLPEKLEPFVEPENKPTSPRDSAIIAEQIIQYFENMGNLDFDSGEEHHRACIKKELQKIIDQ